MKSNNIFATCLLAVAVFTLVGCNRTIYPESRVDTTPATEITFEDSDVRLITLHHDSLHYSIGLYDNQISNINTIDINGEYYFITPTGCELIEISKTDNGFTVNYLDYSGNLIRSFMALEELVKDELIYQYSISPSGKWLSYKVVSGDYGMGYDFAPIQNVMLLKVNSMTPERSEQITTNGGAISGKVAWSNNDQYLAFTDFDQYKIQQVYLYDLFQRKRLQITHFSTQFPFQEIFGLHWSSDSNYLAFATVQPIRNETALAYGSGGVYIAEIDSAETKIIQVYKNKGVNRSVFWWGDQNDMVIMANNEGKYLNDADYTIGWFDVREEKIVKTKTDIDLGLNQNIYFIIPVTQDNNFIGLFGKDLFIYDYVNNSLQKRDNTMFIGNLYFITTPGGSSFSTGCN